MCKYLRACLQQMYAKPNQNLLGEITCLEDENVGITIMSIMNRPKTSFITMKKVL